MQKVLLPPLNRCSWEYGLKPRLHPFPSGSPAFSALRTNLDKFWHGWASLSYSVVIPGHLGCIWLHFTFFLLLVRFGLAWFWSCFFVYTFLLGWHLPRPLNFLPPQTFVLVAVLQAAEKAVGCFHAKCHPCTDGPQTHAQWKTETLCARTVNRPTPSCTETWIYRDMDTVNVNTDTPIWMGRNMWWQHAIYAGFASIFSYEHHLRCLRICLPLSSADVGEGNRHPNISRFSAHFHVFAQIQLQWRCRWWCWVLCWLQWLSHGQCSLQMTVLWER